MGTHEAAAQHDLITTARAFEAASFSVVPVRADGSKAPAAFWKKHQTERAGRDLVDEWFTGNRFDGLGVICGAVSGGLEMIELEGRAVAEGYLPKLTAALADHGLAEVWTRIITGYLDSSPSGGLHTLVKVDGVVRKNTKLARRPSTPDELEAWKAKEQLKVDNEQDPVKQQRQQASLDNVTRGEQVPQVLIETRGEGGFVVTAPSGGRSHPSGKAWAMICGGIDTIATITSDERDALFAVASLLDEMPAPPAPPRPPRPRQAGDSLGDELRPGDDFAAKVDWADILDPHGITIVARYGNGYTLRRAGKSFGISGTIGTRGDGDNLYMFSTSTLFEAETPYTKFGAYALLEHGGDHAAAARALRAEGYGSPRKQADSQRPAPSAPDYPTDPDVLESLMPPDDEEGDHHADHSAAPVEPSEMPPPSDDEDPGDDALEELAKPGPPRFGLFPETFWEARPEFTHIRQAAHSQGCSGEVAFYTVLTRLSAMLDHRIKANTGMRGRASLNFFAAIVGPASAGKTTGKKAGSQLLAPPLEKLDFRDNLPIGTGEGIAEVFMGEREETDGETHTKKTATANVGDPVMKMVRKQVRHNAFFYVDEGEALVKLASRSGSTMGETIRRAAMGDALGQTNAEAARNRNIPEGMYSMGMLVGFQPESALPLLQEATLGTPQRFIWSPVTDPSIPARFEDKPEHPGLLLHQPHLAEVKEDWDIEFPVEVQQELWEINNLRSRGEVEVDIMNGHEQMTRIKLASLLALLNGRWKVSLEDWELSRILWRASCSLRNSLMEQARRAAAREQEQRTAEYVEKKRRAAAAESGDQVTVKRVALFIVRKVTEAPLTVGAIRKSMASRDREWLGRGLDYGSAEGWLSEEGGRISLGETRQSSR
jgi:hypothetical protein